MEDLIQEVSLNVKCILPDMYFSALHQSIYINSEIYSLIHPNGIIEINMKPKERSRPSLIRSLGEEFETYFEFFKSKNLIEDVSVTGISSNIDLGAGSTRFSTISSNLALILTRVIEASKVLPVLHTGTDTYQGVAEYFRFMRYSKSGQHFPHYDSNFQFLNSNYFTKYSLVVYHDDCDDGEIYFCKDPRSPGLIGTDWDRQATEEEIYLKIKSESMKIVLFPHTLCHGVAEFTGSKRDIIRGDLIFKRQN